MSPFYWCLCQACWPASFLTVSCLCLPSCHMLGLQVHATVPSFKVVSEDLNSGSDACLTNAWATEASPQRFQFLPVLPLTGSFRSLVIVVLWVWGTVLQFWFSYLRMSRNIKHLFITYWLCVFTGEYVLKSLARFFIAHLVLLNCCFPRTNYWFYWLLSIASLFSTIDKSLPKSLLCPSICCWFSSCFYYLMV